MRKSNYLRTFAGLIIFGVLTFGCSNNKVSEEKPTPKVHIQANSEIYKTAESINSADKALEMLLDGNRRFVSGDTIPKDIGRNKRSELANKGQHPFAVVVACSDSRVPPEVIFDQGLGDIFIVRDAGNVIGVLELGSVEYGVEHLRAPLILVLGHEKCGAVKAVVDGTELEGSMHAIANRLKSPYEKVRKYVPNASKEELYNKTEDENIKNSMAEIRKSEIIKKLEKEKKIKIIGAKYYIETGEVVLIKVN